MSGKSVSRSAAGSMTRRDFLAVGGAGALTVLTDGLHALGRDVTGRRPNIIIILADDLGYADVGFHGCKDIPTPHIDSIAANGVKFTSAYVSCPVCSPTRAGLVTGRYQNRFGHEFNTGGAPHSLKETVGLPVKETTFADVMKTAGYKTGVIGKWHLGIHPKFHPFKRGFDEFFGFLTGSHSYNRWDQPKWSPVQRGQDPVHEKEYLTDAFSREAVAFIERHKDRPFLLYLPYNAPHTPMQAAEKYLKRFSHIQDEKRRTYAAMVSAVDDGVGAILAKLKECNTHDNTLMFFFSDNGGPHRTNGSRNTPLNGGKSSMLEGGIRVPFALQWPARIKSGGTYEQPIISLDIFPTIAAAGGAALPEDRLIDGINLLPYLVGKKSGAPHEMLFWRRGKDYAARKGNWKVIKRKGQWRLYDLAADLQEKKDLAEERPELVKELVAAIEKWDAELVEPKWIAIYKRRKKKT